MRLCIVFLRFSPNVFRQCNINWEKAVIYPPVPFILLSLMALEYKHWNPFLISFYHTDYFSCNIEPEDKRLIIACVEINLMRRPSRLTRDPRKNHRVLDWYRSLSMSEQPFETTHPECFAVICSVIWVRKALKGSLFTIGTDHSTLQWSLNIMVPTGELSRELLLL